MKVAIIGAGFSGLASAFHLLKSGHAVTLFDTLGIGAGASGIAAGLLHSYLGPHAKKSPQADEAMKEALFLLEKAAEYGPVASYTGILRPAVSPEQIADFQKCAALYKDVEWWEKEKVVEYLPSLEPVPALFIRSGITVDCPSYLHHLFLLIQSMGAELKVQEIKSKEELHGFDQILFTVGAGIKKLFPELSLSFLKGQILEVEQTIDLPFAVSGSAYCIGSTRGATFEREFEDTLPNKEVAEAYIQPRIAEYSKALSCFKTTGCRAGIRVYTRDKIPALTHMQKNIWVLTGMGARGLLYHGLMGKRAAQEMI